MAAEKKNLVNWNDDLSVGIQKIDEQHKILINLLNRLYQTMVSNKLDAKAATTALDELVHYINTHFVFEEGLMRTFNYPAYTEHKAYHDAFTKRVGELHARAVKGEIAVGMQLWMLVRGWLTEHILIEDKKYTPFFVKRGL